MSHYWFKRLCEICLEFHCGRGAYHGDSPHFFLHLTLCCDFKTSGTIWRQFFAAGTDHHFSQLFSTEIISCGLTKRPGKYVQTEYKLPAREIESEDEWRRLSGDKLTLLGLGRKYWILKSKMDCYVMDERKDAKLV